MKRDMELVRAILLATEAHPKGSGWIDVKIEGYSQEEVAYHVKLLADAGLIEAHDLTTQGDFCWKPSSLTWHGHEFLDAVRNDTVWAKTKEVVKEKGGSVPFAVLQALVIKIAGAAFGLGEQRAATMPNTRMHPTAAGRIVSGHG